MSGMKVMQVLASSSDGGAEKACADIVEALHHAGLDQHVVMRAHSGRQKRFERLGISYDVLKFGGDLDVFSTFKLKKIIKKQSPDIVQTWLSRAARKLPPKKEPGPENHPLYVSRLGGYYKLKNYAKTDFFVANTPDIRKYLISEGVTEDRVTYIPNYAPLEEDVTPVSRTSLDTPEDAPVFITMSRLHEDKGIDTFLKALADVPGAYGWIAGTGPQEEELKDLARELKISDRVCFLGWREDVGALLKAADVFVLASRQEPFGNAFVNAWAYEVPVIASMSQGPRQFIDDKKDGLLFAIDDAQELARHMQNLIDDPAQKEALGEKGYHRYLNEFSKDICVTAYLDYYKRLRKRFLKDSTQQ